MKTFLIAIILFLGRSEFFLAQTSAKAPSADSKNKNSLYMDVHRLEPGKVKFEDVDAAHKKDLATQDKYGVNFQKYWVDEERGLVYCLSSAPTADAVIKTHTEAHGLVPSDVYLVTDGEAAAISGSNNLFLDIHYLEAGKVTVKDVAEAHKKDLAVQNEYGVNFINYWVNEEEGVVICLSQAPNTEAVINTHKHAHGLIPTSVLSVKEGK